MRHVRNRSGKRERHSLIVTSLVGLATMVLPLVGVTPASAAKPRPVPLAAQVEKLDSDGGEAPGVARKRVVPPSAKLPAPVWPAAGRPVPIRWTKAPNTTASAPAVSATVVDRARVPQQWRAGLVTRVSGPAAGTAAVT